MKYYNLKYFLSSLIYFKLKFILDAKVNFQHYYSSLECHMILSYDVLLFKKHLSSMLKIVVLLDIVVEIF